MLAGRKMKQNELTNQNVFALERFYKIYISQIPQHLGHNELKEIFAEFGPIHDLSIMHDQHTGENLGCCLITFYLKQSTIDAQEALNSKLIFPTLSNSVAIQADDENRLSDRELFLLCRSERKIFVGMISRNLNEIELTKIFQPFGQITSIIILKDANGISRGCAFVTYSNNFSALKAISIMHRSQIMENCSAPLNVKFASQNVQHSGKRPLEKTRTDSSIQQTNSFTNSLNSLLIFQQLINNLNKQLKFQQPSENGSGDSGNTGLLATSWCSDSSLGDLQPHITRDSVNSNIQYLKKINYQSRYKSHLPNYLLHDSNLSVSHKQITGPENSNLFIYHLPVIFG